MHTLTEDQKFIRDFAIYARSRGKVKYKYMDWRNCACAQFLRDTGRAIEPSVGSDGWTDTAVVPVIHGRQSLPEGMRGGSNVLNHSYDGNNFAALADRLEALLPFAVSAEMETV